MVWDTYAFRWIIFELLSTYHFGKMVCFFMSDNYRQEISQLNSLIGQLEDVNIDEGTATINSLKRKELILKEKAVLDVHKNKISQIEISDRGKKRVCWQTRIPSQSKKIRKPNYEAVILELYKFYFDESEVRDYSFGHFFKIALEERASKRALALNTVTRYKKTYNAFLAPLANLDVRNITKDYLEGYLLETAKKFHDEHRAEKFYNVKTNLNLVFNYCLQEGILKVNPVPADNFAYKKTIAKTKPKPEDKAFQPYEIELIRNKCYERIERYKYDINAFAILFSSYTGVRAGEIPTLKWNDIDFKMKQIHIHTQQLIENGTAREVPYTKDEKGIPNGGRLISLDNRVEEILTKLREVQKSIDSPYVFCSKDGKCIRKDSYASALRKLCIGDSSKGTVGLGLRLYNNHAFRISYNSYVLVPMGLTSTERAKILGHSPKVNEEYYTFGLADESISRVTALLNQFYESVNPCEPTIQQFNQKEKSLETANFKAL